MLIMPFGVGSHKFKPKVLYLHDLVLDVGCETSHHFECLVTVTSYIVGV